MDSGRNKVTLSQKIDGFKEPISDENNHHWRPKGDKIKGKLYPIKVDFGGGGGVNPLLVSDKLGLQLSPKSAKIGSNTALVSAVKKCRTDLTSVVCGQDHKNEKPRKGRVVQKKSIKEMKNELELKSMRPITSFLQKKKQIVQSNDGESNP